MHTNDRITRLLYINEKNCFVASDVKGRLHLLDLDLNVFCTSDTTSFNSPINAIEVTDKYVITKNRRGAIAKWDINTLHPLDIYEEHNICDKTYLWEQEEPSPTAARGISVYNGKVYTNNGYGQIVVLDLESFEIIEIRNPLTNESFIDCVSTEAGELHAISETSGVLHIGNLETGDFPINIQIDESNVHGVRYDKRHHRFWATQDSGLDSDQNVANGVITIDVNGENLSFFPFSQDDVEFLLFDDDCRYVYAGGFEGYIYVFDNYEKEFRLDNIIGPFPYFIINVVFVSHDDLYVLMQNGEIVCSDSKGNIKKRSGFNGSCIWEMASHPSNDSIVYCAKEEGIEILNYELGNYDSIQIKKVSKHSNAFGINRRIRVLDDGSYVAITQGKYIYKATEIGNIEWFKRIDSVPRSLAISSTQDEVMVGTDGGHVIVLSITGEEKHYKLISKAPVWAVDYLLDQRRIMCFKDGTINIYSDVNLIEEESFQIEAFPKRIIKCTEDSVYIVGSYGLIEIDLNTKNIKNTWTELLINTKENAIMLNDNIYILSYGYQMGTYIMESDEIIDLKEDFQDFPKSIIGKKTSDGEAILLVGGRGGFLNVYRTQNGIPFKVRELYLH
ncbi:WD40 repeat domain-containing protein [Paenibacillus hunanensis]|uniref:WD40 repeat protein n=1 Tax=Paenibacillus hunanensis TaxID=539262 RepID=A0ABU1IZR7_9BACL|nr:WD40 repeat domain-containing protein [Paenibacillus hunanensis]MDR6243837.1 WD40 repeat protein [Paenibacillus hunanensis]GGJ25241.1 hypothetical protein GCM10008022_37670 [Paenibacillus hunanensis]